ncbi:MAG TPA: sensor histidine kinase [Ignavibacteria bacterium]
MFYIIVSPRILNKKGILLLILFEILYLTVFGYIFAFIYYFPIAYVYSASNPIEYTLTNGINSIIFDVIAYLTIVSILGSLSKISLLWYDNIMKQKEMEKQLISNELALLRSQINPQFLFNTLTNIKSLIELQPEKAIYSIENLSEIMSYMLYETSAEKVLLDDEIDYINNYLNLQRVRYNKDFISFEVTGVTNGLLVSPLIFMPFIENAVKFGESFFRSPGIVINLNVTDNNLLFEVMNYIKENANLEKSESSFSTTSIRRCLDLLFGNNYNLDIKNENNKNLIKLNIVLNA